MCNFFENTKGFEDLWPLVAQQAPRTNPRDTKGQLCCLTQTENMWHDLMVRNKNLVAMIQLSMSGC